MRIPSSYLVQFHEPEGYLDFARFGPPSFAVVDTTARLVEASAAAGPSTVDDLMRQELRAKAAVARLCRGDTDHVTLLPNTSTGLFQAALGVSGEVLVSSGEFPANTYPWARSPSVDVSWLPPGPVTADVVREALTPETVALSVSAVDFRTGYRADLAALREVVGDRLLVVDGIQGFGVVDEPWEVADVLVVGGQKWVRAGWSTGFMTLSDRALSRLDPVLSGWTGAEDAGLFDNGIHPVGEGAAGWSITNLSPVASEALAAGLELVELAGVEAIFDRVVERSDELAEVIRAVGGEVVSAVDRRAGILAFTLPGHPPSVVGAALADAGVTATVRPEHVRLSPHASTTGETVARFAAALKEMRGPAAVVVPSGSAGSVGSVGSAGSAGSAGFERAGAVTAEVLNALVPTVNSLAAALGPGTEVVLHDLGALPNSIIAIAGDLTGRKVGGPMTDLLLGLVRRGTTQDLAGYETYAPDGRVIHSSTVFLRDERGVAVGCLCVNREPGLDRGPEPAAVVRAAGAPVEVFPGDVDTLQRVLVERAVAAVGVPVELMKKSHKSQVVKVLDEAGLFLIRDSVDYLAGVLGVTRYTIYNYLNEIRA
ncbi:aminotransferase class V-fold PLP-dependent enzyme [Saccharothrix sp. S26]|uniref:aminotransferase class V-fold PLP-dependent enzyme n=1 Tax=Saccharothrix sp. S26 TaxID=2907215 RepID=UPI001F42726E|nr:aminotransferase class V-fold PLP-dependent enzyme [Saccharothrix sp. S26]MCE6996769.1 aminotransferase class V-fold PLP-dependent enzyme [Saccharothrix sp. S26]